MMTIYGCIMMTIYVCIMMTVNAAFKSREWRASRLSHNWRLTRTCLLKFINLFEITNRLVSYPIQSFIKLFSLCNICSASVYLSMYNMYVLCIHVLCSLVKFGINFVQISE